MESFSISVLQVNNFSRVSFVRNDFICPDQKKKNWTPEATKMRLLIPTLARVVPIE